MYFEKDNKPTTKENSLRMKIIDANNRYRLGYPIMTDQEFDDLCEQYQSQISEKEWNSFRDSLHENPGKVKHPFVMGSLNKLKFEEPQEVWKFINEYVKEDLSISKKIDGISCRLFYDKGKLISASTRGDGYFGEDLTDKIRYVKNVPQNIEYDGPMSVRGELIILKDDFDKMNENGEWKNPRNACAGLMNRKEFTPEEISNVSFICYTILGKGLFKRDQFQILINNYFKVVKYFVIPKEKLMTLMEDTTGQAICNELYKYYEYETPYECDGLVISDIYYVNEDKYRPDAQVAFKVNELIGETTLIDVSWEGPSKSGKMVPIGILDGVELGGSLISRVTLNNIDFIEKFGLKYGARVKISKSGNIIPKLIGVTKEGVSQILYPDICPSCGEKLIREGADLKCKNMNCLSLKYSQILNIIQKFKIDNVSLKTLENWNLNTIDDILAFRARQEYKSEQKFILELERKMFQKTDLELFYRMVFNGLSDKLLAKIVEFYGWDKIKATFIQTERGWTFDGELVDFPEKYGWPNGIGRLMWDRFLESLEPAIQTMHKIMSDGRYVGKVEMQGSEKKPVKGSICVTGGLKFGKRDDFLKFAKDHGYEPKSGVAKGLTYLINNDATSSSSKNRKAKELGIHILTEDQFMKIIKEDSNESSLDDL